VGIDRTQSGAGLALGTDHRRALGDPPQRLAQVGRTTHERNDKAVLVDVVGLVGGGQHLRLVDVIDLQGLEDLCLDEVADTALGHHGDRDGILDALDHLRVAHPGDATIGADVGGNALQSHYGARPGIFRDTGLLRGCDVHDDAALELLS
jgi:hypothetical protein